MGAPVVSAGVRGTLVNLRQILGFLREQKLKCPGTIIFRARLSIAECIFRASEPKPEEKLGMALAADLPNDRSLGQIVGQNAGSQGQPAPADAPKTWLERHKVTLAAYAAGLLLLGVFAAHVHSTLLEITAPLELAGPIEIETR